MGGRVAEIGSNTAGSEARSSFFRLGPPCPFWNTDRHHSARGPGTRDELIFKKHQIVQHDILYDFGRVSIHQHLAQWIVDSYLVFRLNGYFLKQTGKRVDSFRMNAVLRLHRPNEATRGRVQAKGRGSQ